MAPRANYVPVGAAAVLVYTPAPVGRPHGVIFNAGPSTVYLGGPGVTSNSGLPLAPREGFSLPVSTSSIYAVCGGTTLSGTATTNLTAAASGGTSSNISVGTTANFAVGNIIQIGTGSNAEINSITSFTSSTVMALASTLSYDHVPGQSVIAVTGAAAVTVRTQAGTT